MNRKKISVFFLWVILTVVVCFRASANHGYPEGSHKKDLEDKFFSKVQMVLAHQDKFRLSEMQVQNIKKLELDTKKDLISKKAEIDVADLDIEAGLKEDNIDVDATGKMIDLKYDLKKAKTMMLMRALASLKSILTLEQKGQLKLLYMEKHKKHKGMKRE